MKKVMLAALICAYGLTGCDKAEPRSTVYFREHLDEARRIVASCRDGTMRGEECPNAGMAIEETEAKERFSRFRGTEE